MKRTLLYALVYLFTFSCVPEGPDPVDDGVDPIDNGSGSNIDNDSGNGQDTLKDEFSEEEVVNLRIFMRNTITGGSSKTWFLHSATFESDTGTEDASNLKNIRDDEFIFSKIDDSEENQFRGIVEWRPGLSIPEDATTIEDLGVGLYTESMTIEFEIGLPSEGKRTVPNQFIISFDESTLADTSGKRVDSGKSAAVWRWKYWYGNVDSMEEYIARSTSPFFFPPRDCNDLATWNLSRLWMTAEAKRQERLRLCSREKLPEDYTNDLAANLVFEEEFSFFSNTIYWEADMTGSDSENALYIATAEKSMTENGVVPERIIKFDIGSKNSKESIHYQQLGYEKSVLATGTDLWVISGFDNNINKYDLDLTGPPETFQIFPEKTQSFSYLYTEIVNNTLYWTGISNYIEETPDQNAYWLLDDKGLYAWDLGSNTYSKIKEGSFGGISDPVSIDDKIYFLGSEVDVYNVNSNELELNVSQISDRVPFFRHTENYGKLIYIGSHTEELVPDRTVEDKEPYLAVFDTQSGAFSQLSTNLNSPNSETIEGMAIVKGRIYILYGEHVWNEVVRWQVLSAPLE
ncbi:hypothetical protein JQC67_04670 [Aurantibacter crassamenti]|uniref:hypothetical protein n=1 Tax=Aurantibacter crassamenti TaxID=1837375 RepID=UPI00193965E2|nr:hypothetical protein [Aurantibacter crassamenti]MBM1105430.1 hypothetical protein [Aurantibacter crassamenti]